jgi:hypothetical protein
VEFVSCWTVYPDLRGTLLERRDASKCAFHLLAFLICVADLNVLTCILIACGLDNALHNANFCLICLCILGLCICCCLMNVKYVPPRLSFFLYKLSYLSFYLYKSSILKQKFAVYSVDILIHTFQNMREVSVVICAKALRYWVILEVLTAEVMKTALACETVYLSWERTMLWRNFAVIY